MILGPQHTTQGWTRGNRGQDYTFGKKISHTHRCVCRCVCSHWTMWRLVSCVQELIWYLSSPQSICVGLCGLKPTVLLKKFNIYIYSSLLIATVAALVCARKLQLLWFSFHAVVWIIGSSSLPSLLFLQSHEWKYRNYRQKKEFSSLLSGGGAVLDSQWDHFIIILCLIGRLMKCFIHWNTHWPFFMLFRNWIWLLGTTGGRLHKDKRTIFSTDRWWNSELFKVKWTIFTQQLQRHEIFLLTSRKSWFLN